MVSAKTAEKAQKNGHHAFLENVTHFWKNLTQRYFSPVARYVKEVVVKESDMMYQKNHGRVASQSSKIAFFA